MGNVDRGGGEGRYIYCIADTGERVSLGRVGLAGEEVYTLPYRDIGALVQQCPAPHRFADREAVPGWIMAHHQVVSAAWERWGTVLPFGFGTLVGGEEGNGAEEGIRGWLQREYPGLKGRMERLRGKAEYGVQVFWDPRLVAQEIVGADSEIGKLTEEMGAQSRGVAYMQRQRLEKLLRRETEAKAEGYFRDCYQRIGRHAEEVRVGRTRRPAAGGQMLLNLSCLVTPAGYSGLAAELDRINGMAGLSVRLTGPWPPYSFVADAR